jgi:hypothetical protein
LNDILFRLCYILFIHQLIELFTVVLLLFARVDLYNFISLKKFCKVWERSKEKYVFNQLYI